MKIFILTLFLNHGNGVAIETHEYIGEAACQVAGEAFEKAAKDLRFVYFFHTCTSKE